MPLAANLLHYGCVQNFHLKPQIHRKIEQISINRQNRMPEGYISPLIRNQCCRQMGGFATEMAAYFDYSSAAAN
jgi:hypothetical protein